MDDAALHALGNTVSGSGAMFARRRRILAEANRIINESGVEALSIRELSVRAGVASRTIYNAFGSKETVIALTLRTFSDLYRHDLNARIDHESFRGALLHHLATAIEALKTPNYMKTISELYFSPTLNPQIRIVLLEIGCQSWKAWVEAVDRRHGLEKGVEQERLCIEIANMLFGKVHEWRLQVISNENFVDVSTKMLLILLLGAVRGTTRTLVKEAFHAVHQQGEQWKALLREANALNAVAPDALSHDRSFQV